MSNSSSIIVADTSTLINLYATQMAEDILVLLPQKVVIVDAVHSELSDGYALGHGGEEIYNKLAAKKLITRVSLGQNGDTHFESLVSGPAHLTLDDGEAATIAYAVENSCEIFLDEGKARRICADKFPSVCQKCTCEMLRNPVLVAGLGEDQLADAVFNALQGARMNVSLSHLDWVVSLIGSSRAATCKSLPGHVRNSF